MIKEVKVAQIRGNTAALRGVDKESESYKGIVDSIKAKGFIGVISAREKTDPDTNEVYYELADGLHRFTAACEAGVESLSVDVVDWTDEQMLEVQIMMNTHKVETKPVEYTKGLIRLLNANPMLTEAELAKRLGKSGAWLRERLNLKKIENEHISNLIDDGKICLTNAFMLAKLPVDEQLDFLDRAMTMDATEFAPSVTARIKELKDAKMKGKDAEPAEFVPVAHLQKLAVIKDEMDVPNTLVALAAQENVSDVTGTIKLVLSWILNLDPVSVAAQKAKDAERKAVAAAAKDKRAKERAEKKAIELATKTAEAQEIAASMA